MSGDHAKLQQFRRKLERLPPIVYTLEPRQKVQLKTLFQHMIDRDVINIRKFRKQGFANIFQAHEAKTGNTVLHVAAYKNDPDLVTFFLNEGAEVDARNRGGTTPLMVAAHHGYVDLVKLLMVRGANLDLEDRFGQTVLWYCFGGTERHTQIVALCMNATEPVRPSSNVIGKPVLVKACEKGNKAKEIAELFLRHGSGSNDPALRTGRTPLMEAARRGSVSVMQMLLAEEADPDAVDYKQVHAAHEAAYHGHVPALQVLAGAGAHLDTPSYNGNTPLHLAVSAQQLSAIRYLSHRGGDGNARNSLGLTPKVICKKYAFKPAAKELKKGQRQFNGLKDNKFFVTLYDWMQNNVDKLKLALQAGDPDIDPVVTISREYLPSVLQTVDAPVSEDDMSKLLDLLDSKKTGTINITDLLKGDKLVPKGFRTASYPEETHKPGPKDKKKKKKKVKKPKLKLPKGFNIPICVATEDESPMQFTDSPFITKHIFPGEKSVVGRPTVFADDSLWMLENIPIDAVHVNALCQQGDWDSVVRACQKGFNINQCDKQYKTPLMYAAAGGRWDMVQMLLAYGADVKAVDNFGWTALHHACRKGQPIVVDELIQNGSNLNNHTLAGATPLMKAIESNNLDSVLCCVVNGANLKAKTVCGLSIRDHAKTLGNYRIYRAIARYLKAYRGGRNLQRSLAAVDPHTKFALGDRALTYGYGKDIRGVFRRQRFLGRKTLLANMIQADLPIRAVKAKVVKVVPVGYSVPVVEVNPGSDVGPAKPLPRIPVSNSGKPLPVPKVLKTKKGPDGLSLLEVDDKISKLKKTKKHFSTNNILSNISLSPDQLLSSVKPRSEESPPPTINSAGQDRKLKTRYLFGEAGKKFETLADGVSHRQLPEPEVADSFAHKTIKYGRSQQAKVMESRTEMERTAWMLRNHVDMSRAGDLTLYTPAPEDWYPPSREDIIMRYQIQPGLFDATIDTFLQQDPLEKYVRRAERQLRDDQSSKRHFKINRPENDTEKSMPKRISITEELKRLHRSRRVDGKFMNDDEALPSQSLINTFLGELEKESTSGVAAMAFPTERKLTVTADARRVVAPD